MFFCVFSLGRTWRNLQGRGGSSAGGCVQKLKMFSNVQRKLYTAKKFPIWEKSKVPTTNVGQP